MVAAGSGLPQRGPVPLPGPGRSWKALQAPRCWLLQEVARHMFAEGAVWDWILVRSRSNVSVELVSEHVGVRFLDLQKLTFCKSLFPSMWFQLSPSEPGDWVGDDTNLGAPSVRADREPNNVRKCTRKGLEEREEWK